MSGPRGRMRPGREVAGMAGDAVMASLQEIVARLHVPERPPSPASDAGAPDDAPRASRLARTLPTDRAVELVAALVAEIVPQVVARMDLDEVLDRVDVQRVIDRVDVDAVVARIDVDAVVERLDVDRIVQRIDLTAATREALEAVDFGDIVRESTATIGSDVIEGARVQAMRLDDRVGRTVDWLLRRHGPRDTVPDAPGAAP